MEMIQRLSRPDQFFTVLLYEYPLYPDCTAQAPNRTERLTPHGPR